MFIYKIILRSYSRKITAIQLYRKAEAVHES